jgi:DNA-binding FrmR family transcriptional regulator
MRSPAKPQPQPQPVQAAPAAARADPAARRRNLARLRRIEGQVRGLQRMLEKDLPCAELLTQMASVTEALRAVARELLRGHLKQRAASESLANEAIELIKRYRP